MNKILKKIENFEFHHKVFFFIFIFILTIFFLRIGTNFYKESFFEKINSKIFKNDIELTFIDNNNKNYNEINVLKKDYPMISGEIKKEIIFRNSSDPSKSIFEIFCRSVKT